MIITMGIEFLKNLQNLIESIFKNGVMDIGCYYRIPTIKLKKKHFALLNILNSPFFKTGQWTLTGNAAFLHSSLKSLTLHCLIVYL
jgi:hypothetical protein